LSAALQGDSAIASVFSALALELLRSAITGATGFIVQICSSRSAAIFFGKQRGVKGFPRKKRWWQFRLSGICKR